MFYNIDNNSFLFDNAHAIWQEIVSSKTNLKSIYTSNVIPENLIEYKKVHGTLFYIMQPT